MSRMIDAPPEGHVDEFYDMIHLADGKYGGEVMRETAIEWFVSHPDCMFVIVYEHAGWFLGYRRDGSIWATANDRATLTQRYPQPYRGINEDVRL